MSSIEKLIKYVIGVERYAMQNWKCLGQKSNYINETHCEVLIYSQVASHTTIDCRLFFRRGSRRFDLGTLIETNLKIYRHLYMLGRKTAQLTVKN